MKRIEIKEISPFETYKIRQPVLRPGKPLSECYFEGDDDPDTFHLGLYEQDQLAAVSSFMKTQSPLFSVKNQYRIRGMAVLPQFHKKGFGRDLLLTGEEKIQKASPHALIWFNARETAIGFYEKFSYKTRGEKFEIPGVCKHIVMFKQL